MLAQKINLLRRKKIIQGGMGAGISSSKLAREVSLNGEVGIVSGTALNEMMVRQLQLGDKDGEIRSALYEFPNKRIADEIIDRYFIEGGKNEEKRFNSSPYPQISQDGKVISLKNRSLEELIVVSNFVNIRLAKRGHSGVVAINYLNKIQWPLLPAIYGAMLADVDALFIGAGFPKKMPQVLSSLSSSQITNMPVQVISGENYTFSFNPNGIIDSTKLNIPAFIAIVSNHLGVKALPEADGYVFENYTAGGHNAPARAGLTETGSQNYGLKDNINPKILEDRLKINSESNNGERQPYWLAGGYSQKLKEALSDGAEGVQVGTPFAFCRDSGMDYELKQEAIRLIMNGNPVVITSSVASPSGYPFKVFPLKGTLSEEEIYQERNRVCNLGHLIDFYEQEGVVGSRCPAEPVDNYIRKGGKIEETRGSVCLCNALSSTVGLGSTNEKPIITSGSDLTIVRKLVSLYGPNYSAKEVIDYLLKI